MLEGFLDYTDHYRQLPSAAASRESSWFARWLLDQASESRGSVYRMAQPRLRPLALPGNLQHTRPPGPRPAGAMSVPAGRAETCADLI